MVSISLVLHDELRWVDSILQTIRDQTYPQIELIVIDNASGDGTTEALRERLTLDQLIASSENLGFCGAHNRGIRAGRGEFALVLNPDLVLDPHFVERLVAAARERPRAGSLCGKLLRMKERPGDIDPGVCDSTGFYPLRNGSNWERGSGRPDGGPWSTSCEVFGVSGAAAFYRRAALEDVREGDEYFDEAFFGYAEDVDLSWRLRLRGWSAHYVEAAVGWHQRGVDVARSRRSRAAWVNWHLTKNRYLVYLKDLPPLVLLRNGPSLLVFSLSGVFYTLLFERRSLSAYGRVVQLFPMELQRRRVNMRRRSVSQRSLLQWYTVTERLRVEDGRPRGGLLLERARQLVARR